jgi:hypothetical protein
MLGFPETLLVVVAICGVLSIDSKALNEYSCNKDTPALSKSLVPQVSVVMCWREGAMTSPRALREILEHDQEYSFEVIYVHVDLALWRDTLKSVCQLQREFGHDRLRIVTTTPHAMPDKYVMFHRGAEFARSRYVLFSENNSLGFDDKEVAQLLAAMKSTRPTPSVLTTSVYAIQDGAIHYHHPAMQITLKRTAIGLVMAWTGFNGRVDADQNKAHTKFTNSANFTIRAADLVEPHTFMVDTAMLNLSATFDSSPFVAALFGLSAWRSSGINPAIAANVETTYEYPQEDLHVLDVPIVITRWAVHESLTSVAYLERRWGVLYKNQCGQSWHTVVAINGKRFERQEWRELERPATAVIVSALYFYALHMTHLTCHITWRNGTKSVLADNTAGELLMSLSVLTEDIDANRVEAIDAYATQRHVAVPALREEHNGDAEWLAGAVKVVHAPRFTSTITASNCNHCLFRPIFARLTLGAQIATNDHNLEQVIERVLNAAFLVQSDAEHRYAYFMLRLTNTTYRADQAIEKLDQRLVAAALGRLERIRIKMPDAVAGKWDRFNLEPTASDQNDAIPLLRGDLKVDRVGLPYFKPSNVRDTIEQFYLENSIDIAN